MRGRKDLIFAFLKLFYPIGDLSFTFSLNSYSGVSSPTSSTITTRTSRYLLILDLKVSKTWEVTWSPILYLFEQVWRHSFRSILHEELLCEVWQVKKKLSNLSSSPWCLLWGIPGFWPDFAFTVYSKWQDEIRWFPCNILPFLWCRILHEKDLCTQCHKPFDATAKMVLPEMKINCHATCFKVSTFVSLFKCNPNLNYVSIFR